MKSLRNSFTDFETKFNTHSLHRNREIAIDNTTVFEPTTGWDNCDKFVHYNRGNIF